MVLSSETLFSHEDIWMFDVQKQEREEVRYQPL